MPGSSERTKIRTRPTGSSTLYVLEVSAEDCRPGNRFASYLTRVNSFSRVLSFMLVREMRSTSVPQEIIESLRLDVRLNNKLRREPESLTKSAHLTYYVQDTVLSSSTDASITGMDFPGFVAERRVFSCVPANTSTVHASCDNDFLFHETRLVYRKTLYKMNAELNEIKGTAYSAVNTLLMPLQISTL